MKKNMQKQPKQPKSLIMVAPMMGWTTRHYRYFLRLISTKVGLFTEMIMTGAILNNIYLSRLLDYHDSEQPLSIQLGGSVATELAQAAKIVEAYGYREINLNVGCPSNRVQAGCFGAVLFKTPALVAECIAKMKAAVALPVTVKTRIGVDDVESYDFLAGFIETVSQAGCQTFIIHARKAWLSGLSPKANRTVPPLNYAWVYQIKKEFPHLNIVINGGIQNLKQAREQLAYVDGVMIGRAAWYTPYLFRALDLPNLEGLNTVQDRMSILQRYISYVKKSFREGENISHLLQPLFGLFHGVPGARQWRKCLTRAIQMNEVPDIALQKIFSKR
ncbi:MAG: tRNA dihydrouridine(20/20a) synthase DusA [Rickettsiella sp.]|nr:tRNA dihydrouridine(20/20a) synthase DusA [Rickettsiella sp.]